MQKHTAGEWRAIKSPSDWVIITDGPKGQMELASVWPESEYGGPMPAEANARLMAAAPEMLAALRMVREELCMGGDWGNARRIADAAIAKAEAATEGCQAPPL